MQAFLLANVLYSQDVASSYELHKRAALEIKSQPNVHLEWGMQQHRAQEYEGAATAYRKFLLSRPDFAPVHGLLAECHLRQGKVDEAVLAWDRSEKAPRGTLEQFESLVCEVNRSSFPARDRAKLIAQVRNRDLEAAEKLIGLDIAYEVDWWNKPTHSTFLEHDLALIRSISFADETRTKATVCAGECALAVENQPERVAQILRDSGFLVDPQGTLPRCGIIMECMLKSAFAAGAVREAHAVEKWRKAVFDIAVQERDARMFNVAAFLNVDDDVATVQLRGWELTGDRRCAVGYIISLSGQGKLALDHPLLAKALKEFPDDAMLAGLNMQLHAAADKPLEAVLVHALLAEYRHFSYPSGLKQFLTPRPHSANLRMYFRALQAELAKKRDAS
ncbi:MAG: hypothetical protein JNK76_19675 [Planctomycetales bacterium]|nr:hypothetical protein [Planctomycetales bacterium]